MEYMERGFEIVNRARKELRDFIIYEMKNIQDASNTVGDIKLHHSGLVGGVHSTQFDGDSESYRQVEMCRISLIGGVLVTTDTDGVSYNEDSLSISDLMFLAVRLENIFNLVIRGK